MNEKLEAQGRSLAEANERGLTLATLRDLVLDELDADRSDEHLVKAVGALVREHQIMKKAINWDVFYELSRGARINYPKAEER